MLSLVRSSVWSHRQELYPHITACFDYASARIIVHFISPQDEGMRRHLDTSPTEGQRLFYLYAACLEARASNLDISTILCDSGGNKVTRLAKRKSNIARFIEGPSFIRRFCARFPQLATGNVK